MQFTKYFDFNKQTSLYIHIPFCMSKCSYCAFYSKHCDREQIELYFSRLITEVDEVVKAMNGRPFYTAYIGGGNPGSLSVKELEILCLKICTNGRPLEFTVEMNPESLTTEHFYLFEKYLTRLSMGVQSLNEQALEFIGRNASVNKTLEGIKLACELRRTTGCQISFDLISCLPYWHDYMADVKSIIGEFKPDHISVYALTLEEGTPLFEKKPKLPNADEQFYILSDIWHYLKQEGYSQYEVSNFAKNGCISLHNSVYWDYRQYVGLGSAASSTAFNQGRVFRIESPYSLEDYGSNSSFSDYRTVELSKREALEEYVIMGLRHTKGLDLERLKDDFDFEIEEIPEGFFVENGFLKPSQKGLMTADWAASYVLKLY